MQDDVDMAIRVLMKAGAYNPELRRAYEEGEDITAAGTREAWSRQEFGVRIGYRIGRALRVDGRCVCG